MRVVYEKQGRNGVWPVVEAISHIEKKSFAGPGYYEMPIDQLRTDWPEGEYGVLTIDDGCALAAKLKRVCLYIDNGARFGLSALEPEVAELVSI